MTFKDAIAKDIGTFINGLEFAEVHNVDGKDIPIVIDSDILQQRPRYPRDLYDATDGVFVSHIVVFARASDFDYRPVVGQHLRIDGEIHMVTACTDRQGILEMVLEANEA